MLVLVLVLGLEKVLFAPGCWRGPKAGGEPLSCVPEPAREVHPRTSAASNRVKQAAPENYPAYGFYPAFLLAKAIDLRFTDELRRVG